MKVFLVNGSPHPKGCTYTALSEVAKNLQKSGIATEFFWLGNQPIGGCIACMKCDKLGCCVFNDIVVDFQNKLCEADGFIFGIAVHHASASGNMTSFMDWLFYSEMCGNDNKGFYMKPAATVLSARRAGTTATFDQMIKYFAIQEMPMVSSCYWNMVHGTSPEEVLQDKEGLHIMRTLAKNMAYFLRCQEAGKKAGITLPVREPKIRTNFIH